jgi:hypothetical protein
MNTRTYVGVVRDGVITLKGDAKLQDGTEVFVTPLQYEPWTPAAVIAAMESEPHVPSAWVDELEAIIAAGQCPASYEDPFADISDEELRQ